MAILRNQSNFIKAYTLWDFTMWPLAALTGFSYKESIGVLPGQKKSASNNEVVAPGNCACIKCRQFSSWRGFTETALWGLVTFI